jgi:hypothetical protein
MISPKPISCGQAELRSIEMRSQSCLALRHGRRDSAASGSSEGIVET